MSRKLPKKTWNDLFWHKQINCSPLNLTFQIKLTFTTTPTTTTTTTASTTTASTMAETTTNTGETCPGNRESPVLPDGTIRPYGSDSEYCLYKRYLGYTHSQEVWLWPCNPTHSSKKFNWIYDSEKGHIIIEGSLKKNPNRPFCMWIQYPEKTWTQRVRITPCNDVDDTIKFDYVNGRIFLRDYPGICMGWEATTGRGSLGKVAVSAMKCFSNNWSGENSCSSSGDATTEASTTVSTNASTAVSTTEITTESTTESTTASTSTSFNDETNICAGEHGTFHPHESNCSKYYVCAHEVAVESQCQTGLYWNRDNNYCDWPSNVFDCDQGGSTTESLSTTSSASGSSTTSQATTTSHSVKNVNKKWKWAYFRRKTSPDKNFPFHF